VTVAPLGTVDIDALLRDLLQPYDASPALRAWIHARTGGNPLFVEELIRTMQAHGLLTRRGAAYERTAADVVLPASIQGLIQARLDRLPTAEKHLVQMASVIGPEIQVPVLQALVNCAPEELQCHLQHLQTVEVLYETRAVPHSTYTFAHALVQEAAYQSLLRSTRQQYHQRIAQVLEESFPALVETQPELLAQHYTGAELHEPAVGYWQRAGERAAQRLAYQEAISHFTHGLEALQSLPETPERTRRELALHLIARRTKGRPTAGDLNDSKSRSLWTSRPSSSPVSHRQTCRRR
jgi:predicted ATPase